MLALPIAAQPIPEPNINMVAGQQWPGGDPFLQRQNEPSMAVSTRNPLHLLAGANDYRTVDLPFDTTSPDDEERGDAWLGVFKSKNGGQTWWSNMLPGYPQDALSNSPLHGFQAGADPVVRSGPNGMFYYSGIVLNRDPNPLGGVFVARFIDNNNTEIGDPIAYLGASMIATGSSGQFIDKPWIAVGPGTGTCTITQGLNTQTFPAQNVYLAYTIFVGNDNNIKTKLMFQRSTDCGVTWGNPTKLSESYAINQGATIAVAPNGSVYVVWRRFQTNNETNAIMIAKSTDKGATFSKGAVVRDITPFQQGMTYYSIRTNAYPAAAVDESNNLYVVWADRSFHPQQDGRIVMMRSADGIVWTPPVLVDNAANRGHQFMPAITITGGKVVIAYYDLRDDSTKGVFTPILFPDMTPTGQFTESRLDVGDRTSPQTALQFVFTQYLLDTAAHRHHTLDLRATQANTGLQSGFTGTTRVSTYVFGSRPGNGKRLVEQLQYNPPNLPMFRLGTAPFIGDYIDVTGYTTKSAHVFHMGWADNRDVRPPLDGNWANFTPVTSASKPAISRVNGQPVPACVVGQTGMRNQNIYTARVTDGLFVGSPGNSKQLIDKNNQPITRAFVVFVQNSTKSQKTFRLTAQQPVPGQASFQQFSFQGFVDVTIPPRSSATRSVYVSSTNAHATVNVDVTEYDSGSPVQGGLTSSVVINPDVSNPDVSNPDVSNPDVSNPDVSNPDVSNPDVSNVEVHNPDVSNPDVSNPDVSNPDVSNPDVSNPDVSNPDVSNPDVSNPDVSNPDVSNPDVSNPDVSNPDVSNATVSDTTWTAHNKGNTTSGYAVKLATNQPVPTGVRTQLIINRIYQTPVSRGCVLGSDNRRQIIANLLDPQFTDFGSLLTANPNDSTLWLAPGDAARITLRVYNPDPIGHPFDPSTTIAPAVVAQSVASNGNANTPPVIALPLFITTTTVNDAIAGQPYSTTIDATGGVGTRTWTVLAPAGFTAPNGVVSGTFANPGDTTLTVKVTDTAVPPHVAQRSYVVHVVAPITITTASPMRGMTGEYFAVTLQATGGTTPYTWSVADGAIPSGLTLNPSTGFITQGQVGQLVAGDTGVTFRVTDAANLTTTKLLTFHIVDPLLITAVLPDAVTNVTKTTTLTATGGSGARTWSLPFAQPGVSLTSAGVLSYQFNTAGPQSITVTVTDSDSQPQHPGGTLPVRVIDPLLIATTSLPNATQGVAYSTTLASSGGLAPIHWSVVSSVPDGMTLSDGGVISGTCPFVETPTVTVRATDSSNPPQIVDSQPMPLVVASAAVPGNYTATIHLKYNNQPLVPINPPEMFGKNTDTNVYLNASQIVWNNDDTVTVTGLPAGHYTVEIAPRENTPNEYLAGGYWNQVHFQVASADIDVDSGELKIIHVTQPADNASRFASYSGCPTALSLTPTQLVWDPIGIANASYNWQIQKLTCNQVPTGFVPLSGTTTSTSIPLSLPATASGEFYYITIDAYSPTNTHIGEVMTSGPDWHGWSLQFRVP